jgi:hypothetical protein
MVFAIAVHSARLGVGYMKRREFSWCARRRGRLAACGARAAAGQAADHRDPGRGHGFGLGALGCRLYAAAARTRLDRAPLHRDRVPLGRGAQRALCRDRRRVCASQSGCHCHVGRRRPHSKESDIDHPDCVRRGGGPGWCWHSGEPSATGRQRHRPFEPNGGYRRQEARTIT